jgi:tRNA (mo5U34)-methyltransferase
MSELPIDRLSDAELNALNTRHTWVTGMKDSRGRIFGRPGEISVYENPAWVVTAADKFFNLSGKSVVEFGSLEGAHTVALAKLAKSVVALEGRDENIAKTKLRLTMYGASAEVLKADLEKELPPKADIFFHSGVLYHLQDPVWHLRRVAPLCDGLFLNTHHTKTPNAQYTSADGRSYSFQKYEEPVQGYKAGLRPFSRWLTMETLLAVLRSLYPRVEVVRDAIERNGPRTSIACSRTVAK